MTVDDPDAALAANPATNPTTLAQLAEDRADLRPTLAANPGMPYMMLQWLHSMKDPAIDAALRRNGTAVAMGLVAAAPASPWAAPAGGPVTDAPPPAATAPPTIVMPVITPAAAPVPPTVVLPVTASADFTPAAIPRPPDAAVAAAGGRRRGGFGLVLVLIPLLFLGGCLAALALARGGSDADDATTTARQATTASSPLPTQETAPSTPTTAAAAPLDATTVPPTEPAPTDPAPTDPAPAQPATAAPTPAPAPTVRTPVTTARSSATTVRAAATTRATTATTRATTTTRAASTTVVRAASGVGPTTTAAPAAVQSFSFTIAQRFASALAAGDWARARTLGPSSSTTDANYRAQYGNLDASTVVPVRATALSVTKYALRIGLVAHETNNGVKQTSLYCAHWDVDTAAGTVTQVDGTKVRTENGTKAAASLTAELTTVCATAALD